MHVRDCLRENATYIKEVQQTAHLGVQLHIISAGVVACLCICTVCTCTCTCDNVRKRSWESFEIVEQVHEIMVLIGYASSNINGSGEPVQTLSLARAFAARTLEERVKIKAQTKM